MIQERSLLKYILLSLVTCGIYSIYFWYQFDRDVNTVCEGDGKQPMSYLAVVALSVVTCSVFLWYWYYKQAERLQGNAPRYGVKIQENGATVLLWFLVGGWFLGIGVLVGDYILMRNLNELARVYNDADQGPRPDNRAFYSRPSGCQEVGRPQGRLEYEQADKHREKNPWPQGGGEVETGQTLSFQRGTGAWGQGHNLSGAEREENSVELPKVGVIYGLSGEYAGAQISMDDGKSVIIGRSPQECNLIVKGDQVSRKHCSVTYDPGQDDYLVVDYSSNGTYLADDDSRLASYREERLRPGTRIYLGTKAVRFCLGEPGGLVK